MPDWPWEKWAVFFVPLALLFLGALVWLLLRKTIRSRVRVARQIRDDPDINEWLVVFNWSRKALYVPTILASLIAAAIMFVKPQGPHTDAVGGIWLGVFFLNFLVDEYEISIKLLLIVVLCGMALFLWLLFLDWVVAFLDLFTNLGITVDGIGYLVIALMFILAIGISWLRGMFYYVAITPNYLNVQIGPTETGEQISREEYSTQVDTGDFLERLLGFGRIVITFSDQRRQPITLLTGRIGTKAARLESIRGKLAVDRYQPQNASGAHP